MKPVDSIFQPHREQSLAQRPGRPASIVVSGIPASGKTTLAKGLSGALGLPLIDKDHIMEALFASEREIDLARRQELSRVSDVAFMEQARASTGAVLVSFWRALNSKGSSGTPCEWLLSLGGPVVEVHCRCSPEVAERRFRERRRHPGHNDSSRIPFLSDQLARLAQEGPLGVGPLVTVHTDSDYDLGAVVASIRRNLGQAG